MLKKISILALGLSLVLSSCKKDEETDYRDVLVGNYTVSAVVTVPGQPVMEIPGITVTASKSGDINMQVSANIAVPPVIIQNLQLVIKNGALDPLDPSFAMASFTVPEQTITVLGTPYQFKGNGSSLSLSSDASLSNTALGKNARIYLTSTGTPAITIVIAPTLPQ